MFKLSKPRCEELSMCFRRYDQQNTGLLTYDSLTNLLYNIGIHLSHTEKRVLKQEYEERGEFTLGDLLTLGETFYNNQGMKTQIENSLALICDGKTIETKCLFDTLLKLGTKIKLEEELLRIFLWNYCQAGEEIDIETFVSRVLRE
ncbi:calmodulin-like protein [Babesia microti strain RI]|uniref:Calmodulin-like protein n=1 Tax=Babesia microti (strain RI) TaxID=1133968 RepID=A0A1N6LXM0_BABMR|nr:calmodulin-like protein [Babesia microti strain RI]SIO73629.1 calmodulin-like protein [Babesia microti strain RI]|eukprot:XP_021337708.1 calmodulin-like protein [Babesia microti strain RI]